MDNSNAEFPPVEKNANSEIILPGIDSKLAELKFFETDLQNEEVARAKTVLRLVFDTKLKWLESRGIIVTYHGSLQYNDPVNLDVDMNFIGENISSHDKDLKKIWDDTEAVLGTFWSRKRCDIDFNAITMKGIEDDLEQSGSRGYDSVEDSDFYPELKAAVILSSAVLFESQKPQLEVKKKEVRTLIANNPRLRDGVVNVLADVIKTREKRREEMPPRRS
jgi:hypothetical protein